MTREQRYKHYCLPEDVSQMDKIEKTIWEVIEDCHDDFQSREKEFTSRLDNAKKRYESKCQELDNCSAFSTKQALEINDFKSRTCENCTWYQIHTYQSAMKTKETETTLTRCMKYHINWGKDFGCNEFTRKEV